MKPNVMFLISFDLFMFTDCSFKLKFKVSVLYHVFVAFSVEFVELSGVMFFSFLQLLKLLFKSDFHLCGVFSVLVKQIFQMLDDIFFREVVDGIGLVHVKCIGTVDNRVFAGRDIESGCHHEFVFGNGVFTPIDFQQTFKAFSGFFLDFVSCKFHVQ